MSSPSPPTSAANAFAAEALTLGYLETAILTVLAWDIMICFTEELAVPTACGCRLATIAYFLSRIGTLLTSIICLVLKNAVIAHCEAFWIVATITSNISTSATSFLFLVQVCAVYEKSRPITSFFGAFWIAIPATNSLVAISYHLSHMGSNRCEVTIVKSLESICLWVKAAYDTSVFVAIASRIISYAVADSVLSWQSLRGVGLPRIYRNLLHWGQLYYFVTIGVTVMAACAAVLPIPAIYRLFLAEPAVAIESIMACRLFRKVLGSRRCEEGTCTHLPETGVMSTILPIA